MTVVLYDDLPTVRSYRVIPDRLWDKKPMAEAIGRWPVGPIRRPLHFALGRVDDLLNRIPYLLRLGSVAWRLKPDVIHGNNEPSSNREAMVVARLLRIPFVQHVRGPLAPTRIASWLLGAPAVFIPVSRWLAADLLMHAVPSHRIRQVYDGIEIVNSSETIQRDLRADLGLEPNTLLVAMVGMLVRWKGQDIFIDAVSRIGNSDHDMVFLLFGDTPEHGDKEYSNSLRNQVLSLRLEAKVHFMGLQPGLSQLMSQIDVVVSASTEPEPLGLVMIEAMAAGCTFVAPAFGAAIEVVEDGVTGFLFKPRDPEDLAAVLVKAAGSRSSRNTMPAMARRSVIDRFSPQRCSEQTVRVYQAVRSL